MIGVTCGAVAMEIKLPHGEGRQHAVLQMHAYFAFFLLHTGLPNFRTAAFLTNNDT